MQVYTLIEAIEYLGVFSFFNNISSTNYLLSNRLIQKFEKSNDQLKLIPFQEIPSLPQTDYFQKSTIWNISRSKFYWLFSLMSLTLSCWIWPKIVIDSKASPKLRSKRDIWTITLWLMVNRSMSSKYIGHCLVASVNMRT